ncbi:DESIGUAL/Modifying wall lignin-1/2 - like 7 [Theobroma cacao]|nr:DESIGUAL/Modifying wall lignin-1/2 - like 7 [Theobroma cacao]
MERKAIVLCNVVGFLGILSAVTGFAAEATRIQASQVKFISPTQCQYPRSPALGLGLTAAVALLIAQIIINSATGFTFVIAFLLLLTGSALNDQHGEESVYFGNYYCYVVKPGVFAGGAVLALASVTLGIFYYLTVNMAKDSTGPWGNAPVPNQGGIAMGQPQFPPQSSQDPVFVHEDTYIRRQFT